MPDPGFGAWRSIGLRVLAELLWPMADPWIGSTFRLGQHVDPAARRLTSVTGSQAYRPVGACSDRPVSTAPIAQMDRR